MQKAGERASETGGNHPAGLKRRRESGKVTLLNDRRAVKRVRQAVTQPHGRLYTGRQQRGARVSGQGGADLPTRAAEAKPAPTACLFSTAHAPWSGY